MALIRRLFGKRPAERRSLTLFEALDLSLACGFDAVEWRGSW